MKTHTPGPWKIEIIDGHAGNIVYCRITSPNYEHPGGMAYASIPFKGKTKKQKELAGLYSRQGEELCLANAKLIAAAPELLEACKEAISTIEMLMGDKLNPSASMSLASLLKAIKSATE